MILNMNNVRFTSILFPKTSIWYLFNDKNDNKKQKYSSQVSSIISVK